MKGNDILYTCNDIVEILGISKNSVNHRIRTLKIKAVYFRLSNNKKDQKLYTFEQVNEILKSKKYSKKKSFMLVVSNFNKEEKFVEFQSKINNHGFN